MITHMHLPLQVAEEHKVRFWRGTSIAILVTLICAIGAISGLTVLIVQKSKDTQVGRGGRDDGEVHSIMHHVYFTAPHVVIRSGLSGVWVGLQFCPGNTVPSMSRPGKQVPSTGHNVISVHRGRWSVLENLLILLPGVLSYYVPLQVTSSSNGDAVMTNKAGTSVVQARPGGDC